MNVFFSDVVNWTTIKGKHDFTSASAVSIPSHSFHLLFPFPSLLRRRVTRLLLPPHTTLRWKRDEGTRPGWCWWWRRDAMRSEARRGEAQRAAKVALHRGRTAEQPNTSVSPASYFTIMWVRNVFKCSSPARIISSDPCLWWYSPGRGGERRCFDNLYLASVAGDLKRGSLDLCGFECTAGLWSLLSITDCDVCMGTF